MMNHPVQQFFYPAFLLLCNLPLVTLGLEMKQTSRFFDFDVKVKYAELSINSNKEANSTKRNMWPIQEENLPKYLSIVVMSDVDVSDISYILMGRPIHILKNDELNIKVTNHLQSTGLSIHFHGFEMENAIQYDGVVGLTQCAISPQTSFSYKFQVQESPGTYWYHTHSGPLGVEAHNMMKAPLIVHPNTNESQVLVDRLNSKDTTSQSPPYRNLLSWDNERILFFSDGFVKTESKLSTYAAGGLLSSTKKNEDGFTVAHVEYDFGTLNGQLRHIIHAVAGRKYKLRLLNGGSHFAYRISIDSIPMQIIATDASPVKRNTTNTIVDEVIIHVGERFDVEIDIPQEPGTRIWIRADTLEHRDSLGKVNGIRGILNVVSSDEEIEDIIDDDVIDPEEDIITPPIPVEDLITMNCHSKHKIEAAKETGKGGCQSIDTLEVDIRKKDNRQVHSLRQANATVDFDMSSPPLQAHFARIHDDESKGSANWVQFVGSSSHVLRPDFDPSRDLHLHTNMMHVPEYSSVIIIWRSRTAMDHSMHLHGYKMEILETYAADRDNNCRGMKCDLYNGFNLQELQNISFGSRPMKDTFIIPSGGAVATRIQTRDASMYFAHCHIDMHREDGMAFILNVGNYSPPSDGSWLPPDFPKCDTPFLESQREVRPSCNCTHDSSYMCSTSFTCSKKHSDETIPNSAVRSSSPITLCILVTMMMSIGSIYTIRTMINRNKANEIIKQDEETLCEEYDNDDIERNDEKDTSQRYSTPKRQKSSPYKKIPKQ